MRVQGLVTLWGLCLFNEVVICLHRGSPPNLKFTVSSGSVYKLLSVTNKNGAYYPHPTPHTHTWEWYVRYNDVCGRRLLFSSVMLPPLGLYMFSPMLTLKPMFVALLCWGPNANCILVGSWQGSPHSPKEVVFCLTLACLCSHFLRVLRTFQLWHCTLPQDRQKNNINIRVTERGTENTIHSAVCLKC